jgi:peroxiredoxin
MAASPRHPVTDPMRQGAKSLEGTPAPSFSLKSSEGVEVSSKDLLKKGPVIVVMTKDGCPCSVESQPFFNQISDLYKEHASFVGILDAPRPIGQLYGRGHSVPYPILSETTPKTFAAFGAKQSVYVYLIGKDGKMAKVWPGYSAPMLIELNSEVAKAAGVPAKPLKLDGAPGEMTSGCYFFEEDPTVGKI